VNGQSPSRFTTSSGSAAARSRMERLTAGQRSELARSAAAARWRAIKGDTWVPPRDRYGLQPYLTVVDARWPGLTDVARVAQAEALRRAADAEGGA
jgi:hypothetical protein